MEKSIEQTLQTHSHVHIKFLCLTLFGCALITLSSFIKIPLYPVSFTLQTFAIYILALTQSPKQAFASTICYLLSGTIGLPVFCGGANPFWFMGKSGGYLVAFPLAAYCMAKLRQKSSPVIALLIGMAIIFVLGGLWLIPLFGLHIAFTKGILLFIPSELLKILAAIRLANWRNR